MGPVRWGCVGEKTKWVCSARESHPWLGSHGRAEQGRQSWPSHGSQALPTGEVSRYIYRINRSTAKAEFKSARWDQQDPWPGSGMGSASLRARARRGTGPKCRGQPLMEPLPDALTLPLSHSLDPDCSQATSELAWPSRTSRQPNLQIGDEVLKGLLVHPGLGPVASREGNLPFLAAFPLHEPVIYRTACACSPTAQLWIFSWGTLSECPLQCPFSAVVFGCSLKLMSWLLTSSTAC